MAEETQPKPGEFDPAEGDTTRTQALKENARALLKSIENRQKYASALSGEEKQNYQQAILEETTRLNSLRKALK